MKANAAAFVSGVLFAIGLSIAGMTQPTKVIGFLDFSGDWDPSLACVMAGAIGVYFLAARWARTARAPRFAPFFRLPGRRDVDTSLVAGAAIFGVGWGLAGYCPGPAVTSAAAFAPATLTFIGSMCAGMVGFSLVRRTLTRAPAAMAESLTHPSRGQAHRASASLGSLGR